MVNLLVAAALAAAMPATAPQQAEPAMFVVHDADTTIYLFGTFHTLNASDSQWLGQGIRGAFEQSNELVLETLLPEGPDAAQEISRAMSGSSRPSAYFLATTRTAIDAGRSQGMQIDNGADTVLRHIAEAEGKYVQGLETLQLQFNMFSKMPPAQVIPASARPGQPVATQQDVSAAMNAMESAWEHGDQRVFARLLDEMRAGSPDTYRMMFTERNSRWADWIAARMQKPGTVFVAVGAGHLAGRDSVLVRLAEKGISSQRVY